MGQEVKKYICECGREFNNPQAFNGHKSHCKVHQQLKHGDLDYLQDSNKKREHSHSITASIKKQEKTCKELELWISEKHTCEKCGKIMTEKYGSGRFCCRSCANSHEMSENTKAKIRETSKLVARNKRTDEFKHSILLKNQAKYYEHPKYCKYCGAILTYENRHRSTCSDECLKLALSVPNNSPRPQYKFGNYQGIPCDSSWELAFLVYHIDNNIKIERCKEKFTYTIDNVQHYYYPDFIVNNVIYEIKGRILEADLSKFEQFPKNRTLKILFQKDIKFYLSYCKNKYGKNFTELLYDKQLPNYMNFKLIN